MNVYCNISQQLLSLPPLVSLNMPNNTRDPLVVIFNYLSFQFTNAQYTTANKSIKVTLDVRGRIVFNFCGVCFNAWNNVKA